MSELHAAGGWCVPSGEVYPTVQIPSPSLESGDLLQVPRTGLRWGDTAMNREAVP